MKTTIEFAKLDHKFQNGWSIHLLLNAMISFLCVLLFFLVCVYEHFDGRVPNNSKLCRNTIADGMIWHRSSKVVQQMCALFMIICSVTVNFSKQ